MRQQLTVKEALEQGYTHYGDDDASFASEIEDLDENDEFPHGTRLYNPSQKVMSLSNEAIAELLADRCATQMSETISNEQVPDQIYKKIMGIDFSATADRINDILSEHVYYTLTDIELIP